ncbi:probable RNA methyltransferase CG11342 [Anopheles maculipalpis]|uniref:probable RNA methyltransferase CG11342 n=1 Tax=Anopheles maculipalpis TaxID=1496333 RepID=UPI002159681D|nr:probable RNA methyltransferase CG11342 [Anopheles maculipalpis]
MDETETQVKHGNYQNYYQFRAEDSRSGILRECLQTLWNENNQNQERDTTNTKVHMIDIGCNSGRFTAKVREILEQVCNGALVKAVGIDIDERLCDRARTEFPEIEFFKGNILSIAHQQTTRGQAEDPIEQCMKRLGIERFDVICCFSVLMYIHLNGGDDGLRSVLDYLCEKGKFLILELQAWKKYQDQVRRLKRDAGQMYPLYAELEWRGRGGVLEDHIKAYVASKGFQMVSESAEKNEFDRQLTFFKKI